MTSTIILITGANSGVGLATAKVLAMASEKFHIIMTGRSLEKVETAKSEIEAKSLKGQLSAIALDVTDNDSIQQAASLVEKQFGKLDVLINNAAVGNVDPSIQTRFRASFETNVIGPAQVSEAFRPLLHKSPNPYSIYVSSGVGSLVLTADTNSVLYKYGRFPNGNAYKASKAALNMVIVDEIVEYRSTALKIFCLSPGFVVSNLRGTSEEARTGRGMALPAETSGESILSIVMGERDADAGKFIHQTDGVWGVYPW